MTSRFGLISIAALAWAGLSTAALAQPGSPDPAVVQGGTYALEPAHTQVLFKVSHLGFSTYYGQFADASGSLTLDPRDPAQDSLSVAIPIGSVHTTSAKLDGELKSADWFDADRYPTASFRSTRVTRTGPDAATVEGELTLHGVTRPIRLQAHFHGAGVNMLSHAYTAGFDVSGHIRRSEFGVTKYVPIVGDDVELIISGAFEKRP